MSGKKSKKKTSVRKKTLPNKTVSSPLLDSFFEKHSHTWLWLSGLLPVAGLLIIYICMGIYPFGEKTVANVDMMQQYIPFYASLKNAIWNGNGLEYSSVLGMGGSYWGLIGYYLTSPFAALSLLVPNEYLPDYMEVQEIIKVGLAGMSFAFFACRKFRRKDMTVPLLSICYAMSAFFLTHLCTFIWSDCLVLLPLIIWGLEELLRGKKPWLYILCLSAAGISNYYITLMIGIYLVLYAAVFLYSEGMTADLHAFIMKGLRFVGCSLLSVGIAAGILLPSALLVSESGNASDEAASGFWAMNPLRLLSQLMFHADDRILADDALPLIYCSVLVGVCLPLFFVCKEISVRVRIAFGSLAGFLALSLSVNGLNYLWHGAHIPNYLPYRFAFLLVFTLLIMAGMVIDRLDSVSAMTIDFVLFGWMAVAVIAFFAEGRSNPVMLAGTIILAIGYCALLVLRAEKKIRPAAAMLAVLALTAAELTSGGVMAWQDLRLESEYADRNEYLYDERHLSELTDKLTVSESDVCRIGAITEVSMNINAFIGQGGLSYFSSTNNGALMELLHQVGYDCDGRVNYYYKSFTPLMDSVLNVKYVMYRENVGNPPYLKAAGSSGRYFAYRNTLSLPRAFAVSDSLLGWNTAQSNPFEVQNDFVRKAVSDSDLTVYEPLPLMPGSSLNGAEYQDGCLKIRQAGRVSLNAVSRERRHLYGFIDCDGASEIIITIGERHYSISGKDDYIMDWGWWEPDEQLTVTVASGEPLTGRIFTALLNEKALEKGISQLAESPAEFREYSETNIVCEINAKKGEMLFTSIPFEKGWHVRVNGRQTDPVRIGGGLTGIPLTEGINRVELSYSVRGLTAGIILSLMSIAAAVWMLFGKELLLRQLNIDNKKKKASAAQ